MVELIYVQFKTTPIGLTINNFSPECNDKWYHIKTRISCAMCMNFAPERTDYGITYFEENDGSARGTRIAILLDCAGQCLTDGTFIPDPGNSRCKMQWNKCQKTVPQSALLEIDQVSPELLLENLW